MKTLKISLLTVGVAFFMASCGGGIEKDVKSMAAAECKKIEADLKSRQNPDDASLKEAYDKAKTELNDLRKKLGEKYKGKDDSNKKAGELYEKAMEKCQAKKDLEAFKEKQRKEEEEELKKLEEEIKAMNAAE